MVMNTRHASREVTSVRMKLRLQLQTKIHPGLPGRRSSRLWPAAGGVAGTIVRDSARALVAARLWCHSAIPKPPPIATQTRMNNHARDVRACRTCLLVGHPESSQQMIGSGGACKSSFKCTSVATFGGLRPRTVNAQNCAARCARRATSDRFCVI